MCGRFGAVLEEWEVRDAINGVLSLKDAPFAFGGLPLPPPRTMAPAASAPAMHMVTAQIQQAC